MYRPCKHQHHGYASRADGPAQQTARHNKRLLRRPRRSMEPPRRRHQLLEVWYGAKGRLRHRVWPILYVCQKRYRFLIDRRSAKYASRIFVGVRDKRDGYAALKHTVLYMDI